MLPAAHPLASVNDAYNAVFVEAAAAGSLMFYGRGAGGDPTASAVLGDVVAVARNRVAGLTRTPASVPGARPGAPAPRVPAASPVLRPMGEVLTRYHVALDVNDQPGVLAGAAQAFAEQGVSIQTVRQEGRGDAATLVLVTHSATDAALNATVQKLAGQPFVRRAAGVLRVEGMPGG
jgi:homoserine dehydrogenase